jgi:general stress protein 26
LWPVDRPITTTVWLRAMSDSFSWTDVVPHLSGVASVATVSPTGEAHVAIVSPVVVGGSIWFGAYRSSAKARNLAANPSVALAWTPGPEAYVWGRAELVDDLDQKRSMWDGAWPYDPAMFFRSPDNPDYVLLRVTPDRALVMTMGAAGPQANRWAR